MTASPGPSAIRRQVASRSFQAVSGSEPSSQVGLRRLDAQMVMIAHQHPRVHQPPRLGTSFRHGLQEKPPVVLIQKISSLRFPLAITW
jgi:hypothetical protein